MLVQFENWDNPKNRPKCRILRVLGSAGDPLTDHLGILAKYKLPSRFAKIVQRELESIPKQVSQQDFKGRSDLRGRFTLTVDPVDARDFDDALGEKYYARAVGEPIEAECLMWVKSPRQPA